MGSLNILINVLVVTSAEKMLYKQKPEQIPDMIKRALSSGIDASLCPNGFLVYHTTTCQSDR